MHQEHNQQNDMEEVTIMPEQGGADMPDDALPEQTIKHWREKFEACDTEKRALLEELHGARAEFLNARKLADAQTARLRERTTEQMIESLVPIVDSFDLAMHGATWEAADAHFKRGIEAIKSQFLGFLTAHDVVMITETNVPFDPRRHEAVSTQPAEGAAPDTVLTILQNGYMRGEHVIRPAKVIVSIS